jgi:hypothetical protein
MTPRCDAQLEAYDDLPNSAGSETCVYPLPGAVKDLREFKNNYSNGAQPLAVYLTQRTFDIED